MATYANRTDLQNPTKKMAVTAATGQTYGEAGAQRAAQQAVPMGAPQAPVIAPGSLGNLDRPTERPTEPVTAGNHDCNLNNTSRQDSIEPVIRALAHPNLHYLKESGIYDIPLYHLELHI